MNYKIEMKTIRDLNEEELNSWIAKQRLNWLQAGFNNKVIDNMESRLKSHGFIKFSGPGVVTKISMETVMNKKEKN